MKVSLVVIKETLEQLVHETEYLISQKQTASGKLIEYYMLIKLSIDININMCLIFNI
jgi:hypothetical protein